ncbi:hypothetical protein EVAR_5546_1 [Eumeta japonica]|uniref:RNase H type-1 domain-containing protein n=1 Tax=Eumeta variegata TaxID=151549 RepID=A0A4C1U2Q4_EUMVA|nr:hypothetical protein EVAR_5546_1 [Eumeta japonica]
MSVPVAHSSCDHTSLYHTAPPFIIPLLLPKDHFPLHQISYSYPRGRQLIVDSSGVVQRFPNLSSSLPHFYLQWRSNGEAFVTNFTAAELRALYCRAIRTVKKGKDGLVNIVSDSRSSLEVLTGSRTYHPLAHEARHDISEIVAEGRVVRLFWVRAHAGIASKERADEFARRAALTKKTAADYYRFPLSYAKKTLTGHGGFARYLYRFRLRHLPQCVCDPAKTQHVLHVLEDCDMFLRECVALEAEIYGNSGRST